MRTLLKRSDIDRLVRGEHGEAFSILGMHPAGQGLAVRAFIPDAAEMRVICFHCPEIAYPMIKLHDDGLFEAVIHDRKDFFEYQLEITYNNGARWVTHDPYSFLPILGDYDLYLFNEGKHFHIHEKLGAHPMTVNNVDGVLFAVWAPCAKAVNVVGDFNYWNGKCHPMRRIGSSGVWEIFIPGAARGAKYKFEIRTATGGLNIKSDPCAFHSQVRPDNASVIYEFGGFNWTDSRWMEDRGTNPLEKPVSIYEAHLGSWRKGHGVDGLLTYREAADELISYVLEMGYTHIELLPLAEHPFDGSWGYQVTGYYSVTSRYGSPEDFMYFVDACHQKGLGVILDWVPAHFAKDDHGLGMFDGMAEYEHLDARQGEHPGWGTKVFNYGRNEVKSFLISNAVFWMDKYHIDGLRVDAVASMLYLDYGKKPGEWVPNRYGGNENLDAVEFLKELNSVVHTAFPGIIMAAEESTSWPMVCKPPYVGGLGFGMKWNMGWMNDFLKYMSMDPVYRKYHHNLITFSLMYAFSENFILPFSHDEVVHGKHSMLDKMPGDYWSKFAGLRVAYGYQYGHPGKKLLFMGSEFGQFIEWRYYEGLDWNLLEYDSHRKMRAYVKELNRLYKSEEALYLKDFSQDGFEWINCEDNEHSIVSFIRKGRDDRDFILFVYNFTPAVYDHYRLGVPAQAFYREILNSDSEYYGGSNAGNSGGLHSEDIACSGRPYSMAIRVPPLAMVVFKPEYA